MPSQQAHNVSPSSSWDGLQALVASDGSASRSVVTTLQTPRATLRDVADAVHCLCMLHGRHPGVIDHASGHAALPSAQPWLEHAAEAFAAERAWLIRLVGAVGPLPSTPGQAESEAAIAAQRHALDMLAQSDRSGCSFGAAVAIAVDWIAIRAILDAAGARLGLDIPPSLLPDPQTTQAAVDACASTPGIQRAIAFGAQQAVTMHRGLWDLIDARAGARGDH